MGKLKSIFFLTYTLNRYKIVYGILGCWCYFSLVNLMWILSALAGTQNRRYIGRKQKI